MTTSYTVTISILVSLLCFSCSTVENPVPVDTDYASLLLREGSIFPFTVNTDTVLVNGGATPNDNITISTVVAVKASNKGNALSLLCTIYDLAKSKTFGNGTLNDNGSFPDLIANDSVYTGKVTFTFKRSVYGNLLAVVSGTDGNNSTNTILLPFSVTRFNKAPRIDTVSAPDTLTLTSTTQILQLTAKVSDEDGSGDIKNVTLTSYRLPDTTTVRGTFSLYDDGGANGALGNTDKLQGDGIYTLSIQLPPNTVKATYRFVFQAFDAAIRASNKVNKDVVIR